MPQFDRHEAWPVSSHLVLGNGSVSSFVEDTVETPTGEVIKRQYTTHPGAVAIVAWNETEDTIAVVNQYRHPVSMELIEIPAGLLDVNGEGYQSAAARELAEEALLSASKWNVLVDVFTSPGGSAESLRVFLARDLAPAPRPNGFKLEGEEAVMTHSFVPRSELLNGIFQGQCQSPSLVAGLLALEVARLSGNLDSLRPADSRWPARETV